MPKGIDEGDSDLEPETKKQKIIYGELHIIQWNSCENTILGVISEKWHTKKKVSNQARLRLSNTVEEEAFEKRESVFDNHRPELCVEFRLEEASQCDIILLLLIGQG